MQRYREPEEAIRRFRAGTVSKDALFRVVAGYEAWQIAILLDGRPYADEKPGGRYLHVLTVPDAPYYEPLGVRWEAVDGGALIREHLPKFDGMRLSNGGWVNVLLSSVDHGKRLSEWAEILDLEEALGEGTAPQAGPLLDADWYVLYHEGSPWLEGLEGCRYALLFSAPDRPGEFVANEMGRWLGDADRFSLPEVRRVKGRALFAALAARDDVDGIAINPGGDSPLRTWGPHSARELLDGVDPRLERRVLRARSREEMRLLMDLLGASYDQTSSFETEVDGQPVIEYSSWSPYESFSLRFHPLDPGEEEAGAGSELLCAGMLATWVKQRLEVLSGPPEARPGNMAEWAREALKWLDELDRLIDPNIDRIPRSALRLPQGSATARREQELLLGEWLRRSRSRLEAILLELG